MSVIKWYKRDPNAALGGMMELTLEERGAYNTILDLIYSRDGNLPDDDKFICGWLQCDVRVWKRIKTRLIELGKIGIKSRLIENLRATSEIDEALGRVASLSEVNRIKGIKSGLVRSNNRDLGGTGDEPSSNTPTPTTRIDKGASLIGKEGRHDMAGQIPLHEESAAFKEWEAYRRRKEGRGYPRTTIRPEDGAPYTGWWFPSVRPPAMPAPAPKANGRDVDGA